MQSNPQMVGQKRSIETRNKILEEATILFSEKGYDACSFRMIAEEAGINHAVISYHFGNKEKLWIAVVEGLFEILYKMTGSYTFDDDRPHKEVFKEHMRSAITYFANEPYLIRIIFQESLSQSELFKTVMVPKLKLFKAFAVNYLIGLQTTGVATTVPMTDLYHILSAAITTRFVHPHKDEKKLGPAKINKSAIEEHADGLANLLFDK